MKQINVKITTKSNLIIGGNPTSFEIGGIDQYTITDASGRPFIPASSLKGALRNIVRDFAEDAVAKEIGKVYDGYLTAIRAENEKRLEKEKLIKDDYRIEQMKKHFDKAIRDASAEYLFGIGGFNDTPKLIFNDLFPEEKENPSEYFSIDSKNQIALTKDDKLEANPRRYQTVRPGITFAGEILFYRMEKIAVEGLVEFVTKMLSQFNSGVYRLGNSGSRGYGKVIVEVSKGE